MSSLELIIRPFLPRDVLPVKVPVANAKATGPVSLTIGAGGGAVVFKYSKFQGVGFTTTQEFVEVQRQTETKRVKNPQDEDQYVDVELIKKIQYKDKNSTDPEKTKVWYNLTNTGGTPP